MGDFRPNDVKNPAKKLARLINDELMDDGFSEIDPRRLEDFIRDNWGELSLYAHAIRRQLDLRNSFKQEKAIR